MFSKKSQSAVEYLITYGWAMLTVAVVLAALYQLGFFSGTNFITTSCIAQPGFTCQKPVMNVTGYIQLNLGQVSNGTMTITGVGCTNNTQQPSSFLAPSNTTFQPGQTASIVFSCTGVKGVIGVAFRGYLWIQYNFGGQSGLIARIATISAIATTTASLLPPVVLYCVGGVGGSGTPTNAVYADIVSGTTVGQWVAQTGANNYPSIYGVQGQSCTASGSNLYCIGGDNNGNGYLNAVYASSASSTSAGTWTSQSSTGNYPISLYRLSCAASSSDIYCIGGYNGGFINTVYAAPISGTTVGPWVAQSSSYPFSVLGLSCAISGSYIYCVGGEKSDTSTVNSVYAASISGTTVGTWTAQSSSGNFPTLGVQDGSCVTSGSDLYCIGGIYASASNGVYAAPLSGTTVGPWVTQTTGNYPISVYIQSCASSTTDLYCMAGYSGGYISTVYAAPVSGTSVGAWIAQSNNYPLSLDHLSCVV